MKAPTRKQRILELLLANKGRRVPSPELARISLQYGSRVLELRAEGYIIRNEIEHVGGEVHGYFTLESEPTLQHMPAQQPPVAATLPLNAQTASTMIDFELGRRGVR